MTDSGKVPGGQEETYQDEPTPSIHPLYKEQVKFNPVHAGLPLALWSQCLECTRVLQAMMIGKNGKVVIEKSCPDHGAMEEVLNDTLFSDDAISDRRHSPTHTLCGSRIRPLVRFLPKTVETLCPECGKNIIGRVYDWQGDVYMEKTCPEHGYVKDRVSTNTKLFLKCQQWSFEEGAGLRNPKVTDATHCPSQCGMCNLHQSHTLLGQIDLTNRCNLACPICFANAAVKKYVYEPTYGEIVGLMKNLRDYRPCPATAVQFSGGEPTLHPDFLRIIETASEIGFSHVQIASNGIKLADPDFAMQCARAGLHTIYLQFDGVEDSIYELTRGRKLFDLKKRAIENIHGAGMKTCLVPTIVKGVNDDQVPKILQFAIDNIHAISAIAYQPVAFTGRISTGERGSQRYTLGDLAADISSAGFAEVDRDFYPLSIIAPISRLLSSIQDTPKITPTSHPSCSSGTYFVVDENKKATPIPAFFNVEGLFSDIDDLAYAMKDSRFKFLHKLRVYLLFRKHFRKDRAPAGMTVSRFIHALRGMTDKSVGRGKAGEKTYRTLMAAAMHFQDRYNFDVERVKRCVIHYSTPEGMFPFCTYNSGPIHRDWIERKHSIPLDEWKKKNTPA